MPAVLIVEDNPSLREVLVKVLQKDNSLDVYYASDGEDALEKLQEIKYDVVISDIKMPLMGGLALLERIKREEPGVATILMTAYGTIRDAVSAMKLGAFDYITKPFSNDELRIVVDRALTHKNLIEENRFYKEREKETYNFDKIIGKSRAMQEIFMRIQKTAKSDATVLIHGETGTGKELVAHAIHLLSKRKDKMFVAMNCAVFAAGVLESELFGHERGAFTGAAARKTGRFELAQSGSLFLDEIAEISLNMQVKLLRVLQERVFERVGGTAQIKMNARIIAATNKNLTDLLESGRFRRDLFYRLNVVDIYIPPLRERKEDIVPLVRHFIKMYGKSVQPAVRGIKKDAFQYLIDYDWPGNVRELENVIERATVLTDAAEIGITDLPADIIKQGMTSVSEALNFGGTLPQRIELFEKKEIVKALQQCSENKTRAAAELGLKRTTLLYKMERYGIK